MNKAEFMAICPLELGDKVKLIYAKFDDETTYSDSDYIVSDILTTHSLKTGNVTFQIIVKDEFDRDLTPRDIESLMIIN